MNAKSGAHNEKGQGSPAGAVKIGRSSDRRLPFDTNSGSPGPGVWYASREPSWDQSNSATPSRYGLGCPPSVGTAQTLISPALDPSCLRNQNVTNEPSGENPRLRSEGLARPGKLARVKLWNWPDPTCVTQTSICPSRSDRKATNCPSRDTAAACSTPSNSVTVWSRAPAIGSRQKYSVFLSQKLTAVASSAITAASGRITLHRARDAGTDEWGDNASGMGDATSLLFSCITRTLRLRAHSSNSAVNA